MNIYVFGNLDDLHDKKAIQAAETIKDIADVHCIIVKPNEDVPFEYEEKLVILDVVRGIDEIKLFDEDSIDKIVLPPRSSVHDFDLGFQLKYLKKLGKLKEVVIIGLPYEKDIDYISLHSIVKKLVAQDIQGS